MTGSSKRKAQTAKISLLMAAVIGGAAFCSTSMVNAAETSTVTGAAENTEEDTQASEDQWLVSSMVYAVTQDGETVQVTYDYEYDENGLPVSRTLSGGNSSKVLYYEYDDQGREIREYTDTRQKAITYDDNGNVISEISSMMDGDQVGETYQSTVYTYDENGNLLSQVTTDADEAVTESYEYTYDEENRVLTYDHTSTDEDDTNEQWEYSYTDTGYNIIKSETGYVEYYDEDGQLTSYIEQSSDGSTSSAADYNYDEDGKIESVEMVDGTVISYTYTYDDNGNVLSLVRHADNETFGTTGTDDYCEDYTYDDEGRELTYRYYIIESGTEYEQINEEYAYDDFGNMTYYKTTASDGTVTEYTYTYIQK